MDPDSNRGGRRLSISFRRLLCCISPTGGSHQVMASISTSTSTSIRDVEEAEELEADAPFEFDELTAYLKHEILGRLPVISIIRSRLVCRTWKKLLSSPAFATKFWAKHRTVEKWLTFLDVCKLQEVYFYDIGPNKCYKMPQTSALLVRSLPVSSTAQLCYADTSALGLLFVCVCAHTCGPQVGTIWALNPLTGSICQLAASSDDTLASVRSIIAKLDTTTKPRPNYKLVILGTTMPRSIAQSNSSDSRSMTMSLSVFSSSTHEWVTLPGQEIPQGSMYAVVKRFYDDEDDLVYVMELYTSDQAPEYGGTLGRLRWLDVVHYDWDSCLLPLLTVQDDFMGYSIVVFERDKFLILVATGTNVSGDCVKIRIFKSSSSIDPCGALQWCFLSEMPVDAMGLLVNPLQLFRTDEQEAESEQGVDGGGLLPQWPRVLVPFKYLQILPLGKKIAGDQILFFNFEKQQIVSFRLDSPPSQAWTTPSGFVFGLTAASPNSSTSTSTAAGSSSSSSRSDSIIRPAFASSSAAASFNLNLPGRQAHSENTWMTNLKSQAHASYLLNQAFAFEPRIDVDPSTIFRYEMSR